MLTPAIIKKMQADFSTPERWADNAHIQKALEDGLLREVTPLDNILFFTFIQNHTFEAQSFWPEVYKLVGHHSLFITHVAIYLTHGIARGVIKGESQSLFGIGRFVTELNERLAASNARTMTMVVCDHDIHGDEQLSVTGSGATPNWAVNSVFPKLYETKGVNGELKRKIEAWILREIVEKGELPKDEMRLLRNCLVALIIDDSDLDQESEFATRINDVFRNAESVLRHLSGPFLAKYCGAGDKIKPHIAELLRHTNTLEAELRPGFLSLGNQLVVLSKTTKKMNLLDASAVPDDWQAFVELRNIIAHNDATRTPTLFLNWEKNLTSVTNFMRYLVVLRTAIESYLATDETA